MARYATYAQRLEHYASNLIESALRGIDPDTDGEIPDCAELAGYAEMESEGTDILEFLAVSDPATHAIVRPFTNAYGRAGAYADILTDGTRTIGHVADYDPRLSEVPIPPGVRRAIYDALDKVARTRREVTVRFA